jgi:uncharacterized protein
MRFLRHSFGFIAPFLTFAVAALFATGLLETPMIGSAAAQNNEPLNLSPAPSAAKPEAKKEPQQSDRPRQKRAGAEPQQPVRPAAKSAQARMADEANANTISIISGGAAGTYFRIAGEMALVLDSPELRVLPIQGRGSAQNMRDVLFLRGVDLGLVQSDALARISTDASIKEPERQLAYIAKLFNDEMHVIAARTVTDIRELEGKKVSFDVKNSGTDYTGRKMFDLIGLKVEAVNMDQSAALEALKRGEIAAAVSVAAKPVRFISEIKREDNLHLLNVPYSDTIGDMYPPASVTAADYVNLVEADKPVETIAVGTLLITYNWQKGSERYRRVEKLVDAFFSNIEKFDDPARHPKWRETNLSASVSGWTRFPGAVDWLASNSKSQKAGEADFKAFESFLKERVTGSTELSETQRELLFREFQTWRQQQ